MLKTRRTKRTFSPEFKPEAIEQEVKDQRHVREVALALEPRYFIRTPYNGGLASQTRHDYCPQSSMIRGGCHRVWWGAGNR